FPVILLGTAYWSGLVDWIRGTMLPAGTVNAGDLELISVTDEVEDAVSAVLDAARTGAVPTTP
ncbi:MAG: LOG family protein, partial [Geodermatophilaceae bacterium]|nr:LOG family protein [Geodermatophilaceae bacterium]